MSRRGTDGYGETGTGCGVGPAWPASGAADGVRLVSAQRDPEHDPERARKGGPGAGGDVAELRLAPDRSAIVGTYTPVAGWVPPPRPRAGIRRRQRPSEPWMWWYPGGGGASLAGSPDRRIAELQTAECPSDLCWEQEW